MRAAFGQPLSKGDLLICEAGHPMYCAIEPLAEGALNWGDKLIRVDGGEQPVIGQTEGWHTCARCGAELKGVPPNEFVLNRSSWREAV